MIKQITEKDRVNSIAINNKEILYAVYRNGKLFFKFNSQNAAENYIQYLKNRFSLME